MNTKYSKAQSVLSKTPTLLVVIVVFTLGYLFKGLVSTPLPADVADGTVVAEVWTCSMHPEVRLPEPGNCPKCNMPLILVESQPAKPKPVMVKKYACPMFCVPPLPKPGDCPVCGMEMTEVEVDVSQGDGGRDVGALKLSAAARKLAEVEVALVERKYVDAEIRMVGKVQYDETRLKSITAWVSGRLDRLYVDYTGVPVKQGDHLVYMYSPDLFVAQVELLQAIEAAKIQASGDESTRQMAAGLVEDARKKLRLWGLTDEQVKAIEDLGKPSDHMTIYSPIGGIVVHKNATEGMYVDTGTRIYTIADLTHVWVKLDAYESDLAWLRYGQTVKFETEAYPGEMFSGTVSFIDPVLDAKTRTVKVRVNVDNSDGRLKPGMFVRAVAHATIAEAGMIVSADLAGKWISPMHPEIIKDEPGFCDVCGMPLVRAETLGYVSTSDVEATPPLVVPATAVLMTGKRAVVYVEKPDEPGTYQVRVIVPGARAGDYYVVREGLTEGERVVVNGNFKIDSANQIRTQPSMMNPADGMPEASPAVVKAIAAPKAVQPQLGKVFSAYYEMHKALSLDSLDDAKAAAKELAGALDDVDMAQLKGATHEAWMKELKGLRSSVGAMIDSGDDIEKARSAFALLSESMIAVARNVGTGNQQSYRFNCSMAFDNRGADWLQGQESIANPYFGSAMLRCGTLKETLGQPRTGDSSGE